MEGGITTEKDRQLTRYIRLRRSRNHSFCGKAVSVKNYEGVSVLALVIRRAHRVISVPCYIAVCAVLYCHLCRVILPSVACLDLP
jgi:hypothetical protein